MNQICLRYYFYLIKIIQLRFGQNYFIFNYQIKSLFKEILDLLVKINIIIESMKQAQWTDVTQDILKYPKSFKLFELVRDQKFALQDGMHAHEINDNKIDPKYDIKQQCTIASLLNNKKVKLPSQLNIQEVISIFIQIFKAQSLFLQGYPLHNTIYEFTYLYDQKIYQNSQQGLPRIINTLVHSINNFGTYVYQLHKQSCSIKQDDLNLCLYSFSNQFQSTDLLIKEFTAIETWINNINKQQNNKQNAYLYNLLNLLVKLRKSIHNLCKSMGKYFQSKSSAKIQKDIQTVHSSANAVEQWIAQNQKNLINEQQTLKNTGIFDKNISKTLRCHFGPRQHPQISFKQTIQHIKVAVSQFQLFVPIPQRICLLKDKIQRLHESPLNLWSKSYIKNNLFHKQQHVFNTLKTQQIILNDINDFIPLKQSWKTQQKFDKLIKPTSPVVSQVLYRYLGRNSRSFWEVSKVYQDFNILIHFSNQFDNSISPPKTKQIQVSSWYYNFGLNVMIKQLFCGIEIDLYQHYQYPYVFYLLQNLLAVYDRNSQVFLRKFDRDYQKGFVQDNLTTKKKKKVSQASRKYFTDTIFKKALHYYVRSFHRILFILVNRKLLLSPFVQNAQLHIKNRFRIFKNIYFVRTLDYQQYLHDFEVISKDENGYLTQAMDLLKQAKNLFQKILQFDESDCYFKVKEDSQNLIKISIKCSLAAMSLKMGQNKKYAIENKNSKYPQITLA